MTLSRIQDHDTLRALNRALAEKYGTATTSDAVAHAQKIYNVTSIGYLPLNVLDGFYEATIRYCERDAK